jgi:hypothetical protein
VFYLVGLAVMVGTRLMMAKLLFMCATLALLRWGLTSVLGKLVRPRRPIGLLAFGLLCMAILLTAWPWVF